MNESEIAAKWQNRNNPVRSAGSDGTLVDETLKGFNILLLNPFRVPGSPFIPATGETGGYSHLSPKGLTKRHRIKNNQQPVFNQTNMIYLCSMLKTLFKSDLV